MSQETKEFFKEFPGYLERMKCDAPATTSGFGGLFQKVMAEGTLSAKQKELIAIGISVSARCTPCINLHVQKCLKAGASKEEILEAASVAVMMGGGPAYTHIPQVMKALDALEAS